MARLKTRGLPEYNSWLAMKSRCNNPAVKEYPNYGGRGITVCEQWNTDFWQFFSDIGRRPKGTTLDRKDNDGNYESGNCRWATRQEQNRNRRKYKKNMTHCPQGHPYSEDNLRASKDGSRSCKTCHRLREQTRRNSKRGVF